jgi:hypothetical protein
MASAASRPGLAGLPVDQMPAGVTATEVMLQAAAADMPKRRVSPVEEALGGARG